MEKLHLMNGSYLTNAAMLLFSKNPEKWQLGAYVKIGFFETDADLLYQDEIHGSILEQIDKIVELVYLNLNYSRNRIWTDNSTMNLKIAPYRHNITQLTRQKGIKSLWQSQEQLLNCQGSLIVAIPTVYLAY